MGRDRQTGREKERKTENENSVVPHLVFLTNTNVILPPSFILHNTVSYNSKSSFGHNVL